MSVFRGNNVGKMSPEDARRRNSSSNMRPRCDSDPPPHLSALLEIRARLTDATLLSDESPCMRHFQSRSIVYAPYGLTKKVSPYFLQLPARSCKRRPNFRFGRCGKMSGISNRPASVLEKPRLFSVVFFSRVLKWHIHSTFEYFHWRDLSLLQFAVSHFLFRHRYHHTTLPIPYIQATFLAIPEDFLRAPRRLRDIR